MQERITMTGNTVDDLTRQWGKLMLRDDENPGIVIKLQSFSPLLQKGTFMHGGKASDREIH